MPKFNDPNLIIGFDNADDAAVYQINSEQVMVQTVDIFPPVVDDPYLYGQIAAANSLSDLYAMNAKPTICMNILCLPENLPKADVKGILEGGYDKVKEAEAIIAGGHTIKDNEPKYGLCVTGFAHPNDILANDGLRQGDLLILTKPIGSGILNTAHKADLISADAARNLAASMAYLNKYPYQIMQKFKPTACTDITGFGLLGHVYEMAKASKLSVEIMSDQVPFMDEAAAMAQMGIIPVGAYSNREYLGDKVLLSPDLPLYISDLLFDPQTSGGLLIAAPEAEAYRLLNALQGEIPQAAIIGRVLAKEEADLVVV